MDIRSLQLGGPRLTAKSVKYRVPVGEQLTVHPRTRVSQTLGQGRVQSPALGEGTD